MARDAREALTPLLLPYANKCAEPRPSYGAAYFVKGGQIVVEGKTDLPEIPVPSYFSARTSKLVRNPASVQ